MPTLVPKEAVRIGPYGGPIAVHTALGWAVQGPAHALPRSPTSDAQALFTLCDCVSCPATAELMENVESPNNPADALTRGKKLCDLAQTNCSTTRPLFLQKPENCWTVAPDVAHSFFNSDSAELKKAALCLNVSAATSTVPDASQHQNWSDLVTAT